ncbi:flagellar basal body-associated protein : Flagellar basal body-associated protein FliL OS=Labrenzia alexandrii DFL-11 GN=fliL PE=4 SV=1: FliL [Gemmata massiliana]|uniref:Flagellar protein FliL n=1 Tax=Gemmata massiliana TaxID=1210884 RepID=A0A6P2D519_9BACT|nr:flagellar basal body-associated FliL family protein [Gemmata massiliana]VTR96388.1 flagellar basal body-associated protein : Flagellar basal body-associated protein FliL OS=Labrenzia alexandrii DFL-11 GN=fliL PE=4 SV=1: FliL [Gemmata massiliana]
MSAPAAGAPRKKSRKLILIVVCLAAIAGGAVVPMAMGGALPFGKSADKDKEKSKAKGKDNKTAIVPFGEVTVNLAEERQQRYLRTKIAILVDAEAEKEMTDLVTKKKAAVKSTLIGHLAGKNTKDVSGSVGVQRMQRELLERIEEVLYPDGNSRIRAVLFEEYVVQ